MASPIDAPFDTNTITDAVLAAICHGSGTSLPSTFEVGRLFFKTDTYEFYINIGTEGTPVWAIAGGPPTGSIVEWGGNYNAIPTGYLICDGTAISRTTYSRLFAITGTNFGVGDGSTTFNVPDLRSKFARGAANATNPGGTGGSDTHTLTTTEIPAHTHSLARAIETAARGGTTAVGLDTAGNTGSTGGGGSHNNIPAYQALVYMIKI